MAETTGRRLPPWILWSSSLLSLVAVGIAAYLTVTHYTDPGALACPDRGVVDCTLVTTSSWSVVLGIPVADLGLVWALVMTVLNLPRVWRSPSRWIDATRLAAAVVGAATVLYLVYVELFRIGAICLWCSGIHLVTVCLLAVILVARASPRTVGPGQAGRTGRAVRAGRPSPELRRGHRGDAPSHQPADRRQRV
jgi:uncharacterized membrane protein